MLRILFDFAMGMVKFAVGAALLAGASMLVMSYYAANRGFTNEEISRVEQSIRQKFGEREGVEVARVSMLREHDNAFKLTGFAVLKLKGVNTEFTKNCHATMSDDNQYLWGCE